MSKMQGIPIVDLSSLIKGGESSQAFTAVSKAIGKSLEEIGFVYLINHGIPLEKVESAFSESRRFFELESDVKSKYKKEMAKGIKGYHGYSSPSTELYDQPVCELRESLDLNPAETSPKFPDVESPNLGSALKNLEAEFRPLIMLLLKALGKYLRLSDDSALTNCCKSVLNPTHYPSFNSLRSNYYPVVSENVHLKQGTVRCSEHSDWGIFTLLFQDSVDGLEVKSNNTWVHAAPVNGAILMNTGDMMEIMSGGRFPATHHRILVPENEVQKRSARQSILYFLMPDDETPIEPLVKSNGFLMSTNLKCMTAFEHVKNKSERLFY